MLDNAHATVSMQAEVDLLRERFPRTSDLYREACAVMFFRYGVTPTTNSLYQLVRKGSMSAPSEALKSFWRDLRERARVDVQHASLPEEIKQAAGQLIGDMWLLAQKAADESIAALRQTAAVERDAALSANKGLEERIVHLEVQAQGVAGELASANRTIDKQREELGAASAAEQRLAVRLDEAGAEAEALRDQITSLMSAHAAETEKLTERVLQAEYRYTDLAKRALSDVDRERTAGAKLRKQLDDERRASSLRVDEIQSEAQRAQLELARQGKELTAFATKAELVADERDRASQRAVSAEVRCSELESQLAAERARVAELRKQLEDTAEITRPGKQRAVATSAVTRRRRSSSKTEK
jgi:chromosome segregation ATPase